jgi:hypothetical protein
MKKLGLFLMFVALLLSAPVYAFSPGETPGPRGQSHLNLGLVNSSDYVSLDAAIGDIGTANATLMLTTPLPIIHSLTVPSNVLLEFKAGGSIPLSIDAAGSITLTINGPIFAPPTAIFSGSNLSVVINISTTPVIYSAWGTFTTTGTAPQNSNFISSYGTTTITSGSGLVTFAVGSTYSTSTNYVGMATSQGTNATTTVTVSQTSGTDMKIYSNGVDGTKVNWTAQGK